MELGPYFQTQPHSNYTMTSLEFYRVLFWIDQKKKEMTEASMTSAQGGTLQSWRNPPLVVGKLFAHICIDFNLCAFPVCLNQILTHFSANDMITIFTEALVLFSAAMFHN